MRRNFLMMLVAGLLSFAAYSFADNPETTVKVDEDEKTQITIEKKDADRGFAEVFKDDGFEGRNNRFNIGKYPDLDEGWDQEIRSIELTGDVRVILFSEENFQGQSLIIENDAPDLDELNFKGRAESMIVESLP